MTHADLVDIAARWLSSKRVGGGYCTYVYAELVTAARTVPDAIGWHYGRSTLVECKRTRSDFHRDRRKPGTAMGNRRYYLTPAGLVKPSEIPEGWGLLEYNGTVCKVVDAPFHEHTQQTAGEELIFLASVIRRHMDRQQFDRKRCRFVVTP